MAALLKHYFNIAFLMGKPQELPPGQNQLYTAVAFNFVAYVFAQSSSTGFSSAVLQAAIDLACTGLLLYVALLLMKRLPRFEQAYGAICGASAVLYLFAIPLIHFTKVPENGDPSALSNFSLFLILVWSLSLIAHVIRHTFFEQATSGNAVAIQMAMSIAIAFTYFVLITNLMNLFFPITAAADEVSMLFHNVGCSFRCA